MLKVERLADGVERKFSHTIGFPENCEIKLKKQLIIVHRGTNFLIEGNTRRPRLYAIKIC
jgi:hypothetical protein